MDGRAWRSRKAFSFAYMQKFKKWKLCDSDGEWSKRRFDHMSARSWFVVSLAYKANTVLSFEAAHENQSLYLPLIRFEGKIALVCGKLNGRTPTV